MIISDKNFFINIFTRNVRGNGMMTVSMTKESMGWRDAGWVTITTTYIKSGTMTVKLTDAGQAILDFDKL